jgi:hypothetical protein
VNRSKYPFSVFEIDSAFYEDISLVAYEFANSYWGKDVAEGRKWISSYMEIEDKSERIAKLRELHFEVLKEGLVHPICVRPYYVVHSVKWKDNTPKFMASSAWWMFTKNK